MHFARARGPVLATVAFCSVLLPVLHAQNPPGTTQQAALTIDLNNALERARANSPQLRSAAVGVSLAAEERLQARAALLPSLNYQNQFLYTQGNSTPSGVFIGNDGVHIYNSQAVVHQDLFSPERLAEYRRTLAAQALAAARRDVAEMGLVAAVVQNYYGLAGAQRKLANAQQASQEAGSFVDITAKLEAGGEVAHADVLKAQLILQLRQRELQNVQLAIEKARIDLAVLLFPDFRLDFNVVDDLGTIPPLPGYQEIETGAMAKSPDLRVANESIRQEEFNIKIARTAYLPTLSLDYIFGINANRFAVRDEEGNRLLGSVAQATLSIPLWTWGSTGSKVRAAEMRLQQAQLDLELTRRQLISALHALHAEAQAAQAQLDSLRRTVADATESLRLTNLRYQAGEVSVLEVVDAQSMLVEARNAHEEGILRYRQALASLQTLIGNL
jgi:outer membrane protein TolC